MIDKKQSLKLLTSVIYFLPYYVQRLSNYVRCYTWSGGTRWRSWLRHCATSRKVAGSIPEDVNRSFFPHYVTGVDSASNRNEYQEYFLGVKTAGAEGWKLYNLHLPTVWKFGNLILLEPSGSVQACTEISLLFTYSWYWKFLRPSETFPGLIMWNYYGK